MCEYLQHFGDGAHRPLDVLHRLREAFRASCGIPLAEAGAPFGTLELPAIFALAYMLHNGPGTPDMPRIRRWLSDVKEFCSGTGELPYYVMRTDHQIRTESNFKLVLSPVWWEHFVTACNAIQTPVPDIQFVHQAIAPSC